MARPLAEATFNFNALLRDVATEYTRLLERCQILERAMQESVDVMLHANGGVEAPVVNVPKVSALPSTEATDKVFWSHEPEASPSMHPRPPQLASQYVHPHLSEETLGSVTSRGEMQSQTSSRVQVRSCWTERLSHSSTGLLSVSDSNHVSRTHSLASPAGNSQSPWHGMRATDPNSASRLIFECVTVVICMYDAIVVPYELAWEPQRSLASTVVSASTVLFWWSEMTLNFFTGYLDQGVLVLDLKLTAFRYFSTWFAMDLFINVVDTAILVLDIFALTEALGSSASSLKYLRMGKLNRLARIMVIFKNNRLQQVVRSMSMDSSNFTMLGLGMRLIGILLILNHIICCAWFWIGNLSEEIGDTGKSWLDMSITSGGLQYRSAPPNFQYLTSLHWTFTQMTPGSMSVVPQNSIERAWNILCLILGLFVSALLISQLSAKMVRVQTVNSTQLQEMETLSRFFVEHDVARSLSQRIRRHVWERVSQKKMLTIGDLPCLAELPTSLRQELHGALFARSLLSHTVLYSWCLVHDGLCREISFRVAEEDALKKYDELFVPGQEAQKVFFLHRGSMKYRREVPLLPASSARMFGTTLSGLEFPDVSVAETDWISTVAMWCHWTYVGRLHACEGCKVVTFPVDRMIDVLSEYPSIYALSRSYASAYALLAMYSENAIQADLDILPSRVLMAMPLSERVSFSVTLVDGFQSKAVRPILDQYHTRRHRLGGKAAERLVEELEAGKCVVTLGKDRQLLRTVGLCVLEIVDSTGGVLVQIAQKKKEEDLELVIALPATKLRESESNTRAVMRLIQTELPEMEGTLNFGEVLHEEDVMKSRNLGVCTMYMKTTYNASLWPEHFPDLDDHDSVPKFQVNDPPVDWTCSRSLALHRERIPFNAFQQAETLRQTLPVGKLGSLKNCNTVVAGVTILPVKCTDKTKFYAWLQRQDFHQMKQAVASFENELTAKVMQAFAAMAKPASEGDDVASYASSEGGVEV